MILRRVELMGFKSFADRTAIEFGPGISAIVGPNGSGKSNVVDAIRWVLGEGSARALRGQRMEDVIFNGSPRRRPVPLAEVTLTLDNADGALPIPFAEVSVTRRLDRSGGGEYLINRRPCRLRDLHELFAGTGLGRNSFALLGQGEVEEALRARPAERRAMVEEAAGISRFHLRLHEGRRRLHAAAQHEQRLADIVQERRRGLAQLAQQAERAQRHERLTAELRVLELGLFARSWHALDAQHQRVRQEVADAAARAEALQRESAALAAEQQRAAQALASVRAEAEAAAAAAAEARRALETARRETEVARRLGEAARQQAARAASLAASLRQRRGAVSAEVAAAEARREGAAERLQAARARVAAALAAVEEAGRGRQEAASACARLEAALAAAREQIGALRSGEEDLARAEAAALAAAARRAEAAAAAETAAAALATVRERLAAAEAELAGVRAAGQALRRHRDALREWLQGVRGRLQALREVLASGAGYAQGVRTVMLGRRRGLPDFAGVIGPLGDLLEVPRGLAAAIAAALGGAAQDVVTASPEAAERAILALKAAQGGRATFLPLGGLAAQPPPAGLQPLAQAEGALGWAAELVGYPAEIREAVLHTLGRVLVARDLGAARNLARRSGYRLRVVSVDGEVVHAGGAMSGGFARGERPGGLVGREAEQRRLALLVAALEGDVQAVEAALGRWGQRLAEREEGVGQLRRALAAGEAQHAAAQAMLRAAAAEEGRARGEAERLQARLSGLRPAARGAGGEGPTDPRREVARCEAALAAAGRALVAAERTEEAAREEQAAARVAVAAAEEEGRGAADLAAAGQRELAQLDARLQALEAEEQRAVAEAAVQETAAAEAEETAGRAEGAVGAAGGRLQALQAAVAQAQQESAALEGRRQACEREREQALSALRRAEGEAARLQAQFAALAGRLEAGFGLTVDALTGVAPSERPEADRARADALREELGAIGGVRPESVDEHRREAEEVAALAAAVDDVRRTAAALLEAARRIEGQLGQRYEETLATVRRQFAASYERLCGGGRADLVPVAAPSAAPGPGSGPGGGAPAPAGPLRPADAPGLEIVAQPPGKQPAHLELLSGGERTLVAVALLLALLRVRPTAFCILDEVEAALDDANVERCARFLREMAEGTQFIVVTHQKGTMEAADRLVGVTMGETGVSTLLSVRLAG